MTTDERIIQLCQDGRQQGFSQLLQVYQNRVYRRAFSILHHREDALDVTQEVFMRTLHAIEHFIPGRPLWPWLRRITTNACLNKIRTEKSRPHTVSLDTAWEQVEAISGGSDPQQAAEAAWTREHLQQALGTLPALYRLVVVLRHEEGLSYDEIARATDLPLGTVKTYLFRARRQLRESLFTETGV